MTKEQLNYYIADAERSLEHAKVNHDRLYWMRVLVALVGERASFTERGINNVRKNIRTDI